MFNSDKTIRDIVLEQPQATRGFEKLKIDYCCGGEKPLIEACTAAGVKIEDVEMLLQTADQSEAKNEAFDLQQANLSDLIQYILDKHHVFTKDEMIRLTALMEKVVRVHGRNHPELSEIRDLFQSVCADLSGHMLKEERILFPYIIAVENSVQGKQPRPFAPFGTVGNPIRMMTMEHDTARDILRKLRAVSSDYTIPPDACISYQTLYQALEAFEQDLHQHIHLENNILFPRAVELESEV